VVKVTRLLQNDIKTMDSPYLPSIYGLSSNIGNVIDGVCSPMLYLENIMYLMSFTLKLLNDLRLQYPQGFALLFGLTPHTANTTLNQLYGFQAPNQFIYSSFFPLASYLALFLNPISFHGDEMSINFPFFTL
jgi:hypothetical protein